MDADIRRRIPIYATSTLHAVTLAELARAHPDPSTYLAGLEHKVNLALDRQRTHDDFPETLKHGVLEAVGKSFQSARAWLALLEDDQDGEQTR